MILQLTCRNVTICLDTNPSNGQRDAPKFTESRRADKKEKLILGATKLRMPGVPELFYGCFGSKVQFSMQKTKRRQDCTVVRWI